MFEFVLDYNDKYSWNYLLDFKELRNVSLTNSFPLQTNSLLGIKKENVKLQKTVLRLSFAAVKKYIWETERVS